MGFDLIYNKIFNKKLNKSNGNVSWIKKRLIENPNNEIWFCFLGWRTSIKTAQKTNILPNKKNLVIYQLPPALVNSNPKESIKIFKEIYSDIEKEIKPFKEINIFSISLGNMFGFYLTRNFKIKKFVSLLPGPELGRNIFSSLVSKSIKKESQKLGYSQEKYDSIFYNFNCINNINKIPPNSKFYISKNDRYIPSKDQMYLVNEILKKNKEIEIFQFKTGHILSHLYFGFLNKIKKIKF